MKYTILYTLSFILLLSSCKKKDVTEVDKPPKVSTGFVLSHIGFPTPSIPSDNKLTNEGVELGRKLFYEKLLSLDNSISCASCHSQSTAFSDSNQFSIGVGGHLGKRQAMPIFNMAWNNNKFFWDGRAHLLRDQALMPIQDTLEMKETLTNVVSKLNAQPEYVQSFEDVFGANGITPLNISLVLEQFMNSIVSNNSKYDQFLRHETVLTPAEERGRILFISQYNSQNPNVPFSNCTQCHGGPNFENNSYMNNGLDTDQSMIDQGRGAVTNLYFDKGTFKVPSLRNIELTPPYMHDGRFQTLEEVVEHYNTGIQHSSTVNSSLYSTSSLAPIFTQQQKTDLVAFLKTLTDNKLVTNPRYSNPF